MKQPNHHPSLEIRATFDQTTITVYQAYSPSIAEPALRAQQFVAPFSLSRYTWIKPSFLWMMYRSDWAQSAGQERILAIRLRREDWDAALLQAVLTTPERHVYADTVAWRKALDKGHVRVQWDPERDIRLQRLDYRSIQVGIGPGLAEAYARQWIVGITDVTALARRIHALVQAGDDAAAEALLPVATPYPTTPEMRAVLGM